MWQKLVSAAGQVVRAVARAVINIGPDVADAASTGVDAVTNPNHSVVFAARSRQLTRPKPRDVFAAQSNRREVSAVDIATREENQSSSFLRDEPAAPPGVPIAQESSLPTWAIGFPNSYSLNLRVQTGNTIFPSIEEKFEASWDTLAFCSLFLFLSVAMLYTFVKSSSKFAVILSALASFISSFVIAGIWCYALFLANDPKWFLILFSKEGFVILCVASTTLLFYALLRRFFSFFKKYFSKYFF